ncbi:MAG: tetratricopeptide repeat protein [Planctomycetes bacterium]|nr:tetratricopeptide repeat protein [Planctomycetota bacterium]
MQQYRFNFPLFIGLVVGTLVCSGAVYGLWRFQIGRKSDWLITEAEKAREASNFREAARYYSQYLTIHPRDEAVLIKYAVANADISESDDVTFDDLGTALRVLEKTVQTKGISDKPEGKELRRRLVQLYGRENIGRYPDALEHLKYLLESDPTDPDLQALHATYLARSGNFDQAIDLSYKLVGYDPKTDEFDAKTAKAPNHVELYTNLAGTLRAKKDDSDLADRVMEQLVEVNPKSAEAHLARGRYLMLYDNADEGRSEVEVAYQLKPEDADVLLVMAEAAANDEQYDKAAEYLASGKKLHPTDVRFYMLAAGLEMKQEDFDKAIAAINEGIEKVKSSNKIQLMVYKAELQIPHKDLKGARQTIEEMQRAVTNIRPELIEFYEARMMMEEEKWHPAKEALSRLRPKIVDFGAQRIMEVDYYLGWCYEKLGQPDMAIESYELVLQQDPKNAPAAAGRERALSQKGLDAPDTKDDPWLEFYTIEMKKPKEQRDWDKLEKALIEYGKEKKVDEPSMLIRRAELKRMREDYAGARKLLAEAKKLEPKNVLIDRMLIQLARLDPKVGPAKALQLWQRTVDQIGDQPALRLDKADILIALHADKPNKEELKSELAGLFAGIDGWTAAQKTELWGGMAGRYLNLGMTEEGRQYLTLAADNQPHNLPSRLMLFALALDANDDAGMKEAQDKILEVVGNTNDSAWLYTEARRKISLVRRGQLKPEAVEEIRVLVNRALEQRPEWHELHVLNAELELLPGGNLTKALENFDRAQELGRPYPAATAQHIKLLGLAGRFKQAGNLLERIPESLRYPLLGPLYAEILFRTNRVEEALKQARTVAENNPTNAQSHYWYSQLLARFALDPKVAEPQRKQSLDNAVKEMRQALELQPEFPDAWGALIYYYGQQKDEEQAQAALREAQLMLSGDNLQIFLAKSYEALGRWFDAETMYRAVHEAAPDDLGRTQQLAAFYLGDVYQRPDKNLKAAPLINKILRAGADKKLQPNDPNLLWARRKGAQMLAETRDYQNLLKAEKLLASNSQDGQLTIDDKLAMAEILAGRPEPLSRKKAIGLLEEVSSVQPLAEKAEIALGELYFATEEDWGKYYRQMEKAIARFPNSLVARASYVKNLLNRGDRRSLERATTDVTKMRQLAPKHIATFEYTVRLADKLGKQAAARAELLKAVPDLSQVKEINDQDAQMLSLLAGLLTELDDLDSAERIYRDVAARNPGKIPQLANFLGNHRSVEQCFEKLNEVYTPERIPAIVQVALVVVRRQREKVGDKFDAQIQQWLDSGLRENPDSINLLIDQADFYDIQKRYDDAANIYRDLLKRSDLTGLRRAIVLNNLSFLAALAGSSASADVDPLQLVNEAAEIMGPNSDILDTRAVVRTSRKEYQQAIEDLELAVTDTPTASKYFHKAHAHFLAQENQAAVEAWKKAEELGLNHDAINLMEIRIYEDLKAKIDQIRGSSVTQADGLRRAG